MKFLISISLLFLNLSAFAMIGGVSGGGGNMISPKSPVTIANPEAVQQIVYKARNVLYRYVSQKRTAYLNNQLSLSQRAAFAPLFSSNLTIERVISSAHLHVNEHHACWDENHQPVDGSTITPHPDSICISAYNIARKTDVSDIAPQSAALMLHEYGELTGLNEDQAVAIQKAALKDLREPTP